MKAVQHLDVTLRNKYRNDEATLAAWESASHIERRNGRSREATKTNQGEVTPAPTPSEVSAAV